MNVEMRVRSQPRKPLFEEHQMLIISKFHDYYDSALVEGVDKTIVYERKEYEIEYPSEFTETSRLGYKRAMFDHNSASDISPSIKVVGFCGKLYPVIEKHVGYYEYEYFYTFDDFVKSMNADELKSYERNNNYGLDRASRLKKLENSFNLKLEFCNKDFEKFFIDNKIVCFVNTYNASERKQTLLVNCCLKDYKFYKIIDPFTSFQDIMMYISGVLGTPNSPMVEISDELRIERHGFDKKISFRKPPSKNRKI